MRSGIAILIVAASSLLVAGCDDPKPGLKTPERDDTLEQCRGALKRMVSGSRHLEQLCECTTARLNAQRLTLDDLTGPRRDRAMEQVRWCLDQTKPHGTSNVSPAPAAESAPIGDVEAETETTGEAEVAEIPTG